jgi:dihydrodipicolinate synthase/N-acetylneuraminate lyase
MSGYTMPISRGDDVMLTGIIPIVFVPFHNDGSIDEAGLRRIVRFELDGGVDGIGINGFASEAYKLTDDERRKTVEIVAIEVADSVPLVIGIAPGSTVAAIQQAQAFSRYHPAVYMTLPPATMDNGVQALVEHYVTLANASDVPIMVQVSPHIPAYRHCGLPAQALAEIADRAPNACYFKIEGPGSADRVRELKPLVTDNVIMFGGGGGITVMDELRAGASGLIPGVGFNEFFVDIWSAWKQDDTAHAESLIIQADPLVKAVSGKGHEYSLHVRKQLMKRTGYIESAHVRQPTIGFNEADMPAIFEIADGLNLRISQR